MLRKYSKEDKIKLLIIFIINIVLCNQFLQMHYASDAYILMDLGYMEYPSKYFLLDARYISAGICYLAGILNIPYNIYIICMDFIGVVFLTIAVFAMFKALHNYYKPENQFKESLIFCVSHVIILNQFTLELLLFPESGVMCLGILCSVLIAILISSKKINTKKDYIKLIILNIIMIFAYQPLLNSCIVLTILLIFVKQFEENNSFKENVKELFIKMLKLGLVMVVISLINISMQKTTSTNKNTRFIDLLNVKYPEYLILKTDSMKNDFIEGIWNYNIYRFPKYSNNIIIATTIIFILFSKKRNREIIKYIFFMFLIFMMSVIPQYIMSVRN